MIKERILVTPKRKSFRVKFTTRSPRMGQYGQVKKLLKTPLKMNKTNGFFIEAGAADGVQFSNTLYLEQYRHVR